MKLLVATPLYPPEIGGPATYAEILTRELPKRGIDVSIVKFSEVRHLPRLIRHITYYRRVLAAARDADVILALDPVSVGLPAMKAAQKLGKKFVVKIVGDYAWEQGQQRFGIKENLDEFVKNKQVPLPVRMLRKIQTRVARSATRVLVPSEYLKDIVEAWGIKTENISVINNAITIPEHLFIPAKGNDEFLIVSAGRRVPWKGFEAIEELQKSHPNWTIKVLSNLPREELLGWIKAADVFVLNSEYEGFPHILVEAMTLGTPIVATNIRANTFIVGDDGILIPPKDKVALERALIEVNGNMTRARERAREGQERMKTFELSYTLDRTAEFLKSL